MSISVTNAEISLSSWCFPAIRSKHIAALPVAKETHARSCLLFAADHPTHPVWPAKGFHHPVPLPQAVFPEAD